MSTWRITVSHEAASTLRRLDRKTKERMIKAIDKLASDPLPGSGKDIRSVKGVEDLLRLRVGDWRVLYTLNESENELFLLAVRPRGQAYCNL